MPWENIEGRLMEAFKVSISFPAGTISLPETHLTIDEWLSSIAQTDEEVKDLEIPRMEFLLNRWRIEDLLFLEWDGPVSNKCAIKAMYIGRRAYILFSDWNECQAIAAVEPKSSSSLYPEIVGKLLENRSFVPSPPTHVRNCRPDLLPGLTDIGPDRPVGTGPAEWTKPALDTRKRWKAFLSDILGGWIARWIHAPEEMFWGDEKSKSGSGKEGKIVMKYRTEGKQNGPSEGKKGGAPS